LYAISSCLLALWLAHAGLAQVITGTILGIVLDPAGGAVPAASVTVSNTNTGAVYTVKSNADGEFTAPYLPPGEYSVAVEAPGFKTFRQTGVRLTLDSKVRVEAKLQMGAVADSIQVVAEAQALQADASDLNRDIDARVIESMPNIGKNPLAYVAMVPGIVGLPGFDDPDNIGVGDDSRSQASSFTVNGAGVRRSEILLDGAPNTNTAFNEIAVLPNTDSIGQVKIITNAYSAEFGRAGGGVISFGTKSGTNRFHGSLYEYWRNPALNANTFGNNSLGRNPDGTMVAPKGKFNLNQFGGSLEGPVSIPHLYDGKNKTFFFFSYEGVRRVDNASGFYTVPTELQRQGDFTQTQVLTRNTATGQLVLGNVSIYSPFANTVSVTEVRAGAYRIDREPFQDGAVLNKIPRNRINPTGQKLLNMYPLPNITPLQQDGTQNYFAALSNRVRTDQIALKLDHHASQSHRSFFRYTTDWTLSSPGNMFAETEPQANNVAPVSQFNPAVTVGHTWAKSASSLFELRANWTRINLLQQPSSGLNADLASLGFSSEMLSVVPNMVFPRIQISGYPSLGITTFALRDNHTSNFSVSGSWTRILRRWTLKFGGEYRPLLSNFNQANIASMAFQNMNMTTGCTGSTCPAIPSDRPQGYALADVLIGGMDALSSPGNGQYTTGDPRMALKNAYTGFFSQNDWKATRRLTINLGVRWEYQGPTTDRYNRLSQFDLKALNATGTPGKYVFSAVDGLSRGITDPDYKNFAPRVGFAWRATDKTVIRSAYGISYDQITGIGSGSNGFGIAGFQFPAYMRVRPASGLDILDRTFNDAFYGGGTMIGPNADKLLGINGVVVAQRNWKTPYMQQWNFTIERKLEKFNFTLAYVGTKGTRLVMQTWQINSNNAVPEEILMGFRDDFIRTGSNPASTLVANPFYGVIPAGNTAVSGPTITRINLAKPYPAYGNVFFSNGRFGSSSYNALQFTANRAFHNGFLIGLAYTWSKSIDFGTGIGGGQGTNSFTIRDWSVQRSVSNNDVPHRATLNYVWELPFGKGRRFLRATPVLSQVAGGWKVAGLTTWSSGVPVAIAGGGFGRPDLVADAILPEEYRVFGDGVTAYPLPDGSTVVVPKNRMLYFNPKAYYYRTIQVKSGTGTSTQADPYWYGTAPRMDSRLRGPGIDNYNMSVSRLFRITEKARAELRVDANNAFNRNEFSVGALARSSSSYNLTASRGPIGYSTDPNFGTIDVTAKPARAPRNMQVSLKVSF
jgi:hypothetical protein